MLVNNAMLKITLLAKLKKYQY